MSEIQLDDVTKRFDDVVALDSVSLVVDDGELLVLVGPSGCGKTTLLRILAGLEPPTEGDVLIDGSSVASLPPRKRDVGLVFQDFALFSHLDVHQNLSFNLRMRGRYDDIEDRVESVAEMLSIEDLLDRHIDELSGGQKQRVALGRAIAGEPRAFLLDEPFANLDAALRNRMQTEIARLQNRLGISTVHVTHDQGEAITMGDRIAVMNDGAIRQVGPPEEVYREPADLFVAGFIGRPAMTFIPGSNVRRDGGIAIQTDTGHWNISVDGVPNHDGDIVVGVRPEHVSIETDSPNGTEWLEGTVTFVEYAGAERFIYLDTPGLPEIVARVGADRNFAEDQSVRYSFDETHLHLFDQVSGQRLPRQRQW